MLKNINRNILNSLEILQETLCKKTWPRTIFAIVLAHLQYRKTKNIFRWTVSIYCQAKFAPSAVLFFDDRQKSDAFGFFGIISFHSLFWEKKNIVSSTQMKQKAGRAPSKKQLDGWNFEHLSDEILSFHWFLPFWENQKPNVCLGAGSVIFLETIYCTKNPQT